MTGAKELSLMMRNLETELGIVKFYENNLHLFKDASSRLKIKGLVLASLKHASKFVEEIHRLQSKEKMTESRGKSIAVVLENAMREEQSAEEIYKYQAAKTKDSHLRKTLLSIAKDESIHKKVVAKLADDAAKKELKKRKIN